MKEIVLDNIAFSLQKSGGISVVWQNIIENLIKDNRFNVRFIEYKGFEDNIFRKMLSIDRNLIDRRKHVFLPIERYLSPHLRLPTPFVFHSSYYRVCDNDYARNITTVHDFTYEQNGLHSLATRVHKWQKYKAISHSNIVVCISENTKRDMFRYLPDSRKKKVHVIYNGVSEEYRIVEHKVSKYDNFVLFVGARRGYKNFEFLIESIADTNYKVLVCGKPLSEEETAYLNNKIGQDRYLVKSYIPNTELNEIYNSVLCLVYPSSYEGFGIPVIEAQRAGCPVIAFNASSIPEIIGETPLLLDKLDASDLLRKIKLTENAYIRAEIVESGIENSKRFSWRKMYEQYSQLYLQLSE